MSRHEKINFGEARFRDVFPFADYYRFGGDLGGDKGSPFIVYFGGVIDPDAYEERRKTEPLPVVQEFEKALAAFGPRPADLLVVPCPVDRDYPEERLRKEMLQFVVFDLLPLTENARPAAMGFVGYSYGAYLAACLALDLARARALATLGGAAMAAALADSPSRAFENKKFVAYANADDPLVMENYKMLHAVVARGLDMEVELGVGGHSFEDLATNGYVKDAFSFVLKETCAALDGE